MRENQARASGAFLSGFVALVGRPNSGKSTLLNAVLGQEVSVVTPLPQTTRNRLRGIYTRDSIQIVFVDTPGVHRGGHKLNAMDAGGGGRGGGKAASIVSVTLWTSPVSSATKKRLSHRLRRRRKIRSCWFSPKPTCVPLHKNRSSGFSHYSRPLAGAPSVAICAKDGAAVERFLDAVDPFIKDGPRYFDDETLADANMRFIASEIIRKHLILATREEVPHAAFVEIESYHEEADQHTIQAVIHVETHGAKSHRYRQRGDGNHRRARCGAAGSGKACRVQGEDRLPH